MVVNSYFSIATPDNTMWDNVESWDDFQKHVATLLVLAGYDVLPEILIGSKKSDVLAVRREFGTEMRMAVECKCYKRPLNKSDVRKIYGDYGPLYDSRQIERVLIVTRAGLAPNAQVQVHESRFMFHRTSDDLRFDLMDFRGYLVDMRSQYREDGLDRYYVPTRAVTEDANRDSIDLERRITEWLGDDGASPLAILGGYAPDATVTHCRLDQTLVG